MSFEELKKKFRAVDRAVLKGRPPFDACMRT